MTHKQGAIHTISPIPKAIWERLRKFVGYIYVVRLKSYTLVIEISTLYIVK